MMLGMFITYEDSSHRLVLHLRAKGGFLHSQEGIFSFFPSDVTGQLYYCLFSRVLNLLWLCYSPQEEVEEQLEGKIAPRLFCVYKIYLGDLVTRSGLGKDFASI